MIVYALSTIDNPYNPFDDFTNWIRYDAAHNYGCCALLDRVFEPNDELTKEENEQLKLKAIQRLLINDSESIYCCIEKDLNEEEFAPLHFTLNNPV